MRSLIRQFQQIGEQMTKVCQHMQTGPAELKCGGLAQDDNTLESIRSMSPAYIQRLERSYDAE